MVWRDTRDGGATEADVYGQRLRFDGTIAPGWPTGGVPVCADSAYQDYRHVISDGAGGAYFAWVDHRDYWLGNHGDIYMSRLTADGNLAPGWAVNGNPICTVPGDQIYPLLVLDGAGGVFVVWEDYRIASPPWDRDVGHIYLQRVTPEGSLANGWPAAGLPVCTAAGPRVLVNVLPDEAGGLLIEWADGRTVATNGSDIYAIRLSADGAPMPGWQVDGNPVCTAPGHQNYSCIAPDGAGGFLVAWVDGRTAPAGSPYFEEHYDIYASRVTAEGEIASGWPENGVALCRTPRISWHPAIVSDGAGGAIVAWTDYRNYVSTASDLYAQRVLPNGSIAAGWPPDGKALSRLRGFEGLPSMVEDGMGGTLVAYEGTGHYDVFVQHVTAGGEIAAGWGPDGEPLSALESFKARPATVSDGQGGMIVVWEDGRNGGGTSTRST